MPSEAIGPEAINTKLETEKKLGNEQDLENDFLAEKPEGLIPSLLTFYRENLGDIILLTVLISLTVINFFIEAKLTSLYFFYIVIFGAGYALGKRTGILTAFLTILIVWAFILSDSAPFLVHYSDNILNLYMALWGGFLILTGWLGSALDQYLQGCAEETSQAPS